MKNQNRLTNVKAVPNQKGELAKSSNQMALSFIQIISRHESQYKNEISITNGVIEFLYIFDELINII